MSAMACRFFIWDGVLGGAGNPASIEAAKSLSFPLVYLILLGLGLGVPSSEMPVSPVSRRGSRPLHVDGHATSIHLKIDIGVRMGFWKSFFVALLFCSTSAFAAPASDGSIKELMALTDAKNLLAGARAQMDGILEKTIQETLKGKTQSPKIQQAVNRMKHRTLEVFEDELSWNKIEPLYLRLYQETFTEEEIAGMLAFYKTPAGQAVVKKMPVLMPKLMWEMSQKTMAMTPRLQKIMQDFVTEAKSADAK